MIDRLSTLRPHRWMIVLILLICVFAAFLKIEYVGLTPNSDYVSYIATAQVFSGIPAIHYPQRLLKPLAPLGVAVTAPFFGFPLAFLVEVVFFYAAFAVAIYFLAFEFFGTKRQAFITTMLLVLSYPMLRYGLDLYTETGAQFFYALSLLLMLCYLKKPSRTVLITNALVIGVGLLWKEYSVTSGLAFGLVLLFEASPLRAKIQNLVLLGICSLLPTILVQCWVFATYHYSYLTWYATGGATGFKTQFTVGNIVKSIGALLGLAWLLVPLGALTFKKLSDATRRFLIIATGSSLIAFLWGYVSSRLFFVMAPPFVLLAVVGLTRLPRVMQHIAVAAVILGNILWLVIATGVLH